MSPEFHDFHVPPSRYQEPHPQHTDGHALVRLTIDDTQVEALADATILQAAQAVGIDIPTLCSDEKLEAMGGCRLCVVEIDGQPRPLPSCSTPVAEGLVVRTNTERLRLLRKDTLELILSDHNAYCQPPCQINCPTHIDIPGFLEQNAQGNWEGAAKVLMQVLPFPATLGLVCPRPCEDVCRRKLVEEPISICQSHGYHGERVVDNPPLPWPQESPTGKQVAVVGAGPAGLTTAYYLSLRGHKVKVFEALPKQGGMLRYGIPEYRLPKEKLDHELNRVWKLGAELECGKALGRDFSIDDLFAQGFDAVFLAIGAHRSNILDIPGEDLPGVLKAVDFLRAVGLGEKASVGERVVVIGGGFTAFDATRTALRLGAKKVDTVYRRSRKEMGAHWTEVEDAEHEGAQLHILAGPVRILEHDGRVGGVEFIRMELGEPDARGRRRPVPVVGSEFVIECDTVIAAIGQTPDVSSLANEPGVKVSKRDTIVVRDGNYMTDRPGVFAAGDATIGASTVIQCVAGGKLAARAIDGYLNGEDMDAVNSRILAEEAKPDLISIVPYKPVTTRQPMAMLPYEERQHNFACIECGYSEEQAKEEAARCLQCVCPDASRCHLQRLSLEYGVVENRFHDGESRDFHDYRLDSSHSFILRDMNKCINCTQCVRMCRDVIGPDCYGLMGRGFDTIVSTPFNASLNESNCVSCGACAETCPTGALMLRERQVERYDLDISRCIFCGDCVEVCPHAALAETPVFEFANYDRFQPMQLSKEQLAKAPDYVRPEMKPARRGEEIQIPVIYPKLPRSWRE
ncbi:MAG: FAD-dependent oxidoreductase [Chloroflexota bacterium]